MMMFEDKIANIVYKSGKSINEICNQYGMDRTAFHRARSMQQCPQRTNILAWAYMLHMDVEELVAGTDVESYWFGGERRRSGV